MLTHLKKQIANERNVEVLQEALSGRTNADDLIKSAFLDNWEADLLGAETDPKVKALVESVPQYDDHDEDVAKDIKALTESLEETELI